MALQVFRFPNPPPFRILYRRAIAAVIILLNIELNLHQRDRRGYHQLPGSSIASVQPWCQNQRNDLGTNLLTPTTLTHLGVKLGNLRAKVVLPLLEVGLLGAHKIDLAV